ncbi:MAG: CoA transferase subunit A [Candidatus Helarchaeota archaeon]
MTKIMSMHDAIKKYVHDGSFVSIGACGTGCPYNAIHEIIRQERKNLKVIQPTSMFEIDQLAGCGCVKEIIYSWSYRATRGLRAFDRAIQQYDITVKDYTNFTTAAMLAAGARGLPFYPAKMSVYHTDIYRRRIEDDMFKVIDNPFNPGEKVLLVPAVNPDVGIMHVQRVDEEGNAQFWAANGTMRDGLLSCKHIIISAEEIIEKEIVQASPNYTLIPGFRVDAIIHEPWGAHPAGMLGYYEMDRHMIALYTGSIVLTPVSFQTWVQDWILSVNDRGEYIEKYAHTYGVRALEKLRARSFPSASVNLGSTFRLERDLMNLSLEDIYNDPDLKEFTEEIDA